MLYLLLQNFYSMNFDEKAKAWDDDPDRAARAVAFAGEILKETGDRKFHNALEFGSGTGNVSIQLAEKCISITLADTSEGMIDVLKSKITAGRISNMKPFLINGSNPLTNLKGFDVIYTLLTLHHVKDLDKVFSDFYKVLNPGGLVFIGDLVTEDGSFHFRDPEFDGYKGFEVSELKKLMKKNGLDPLSDRIFYTIKREYQTILREYPLFILAGKKRYPSKGRSAIYNRSATLS